MYIFLNCEILLSFHELNQKIVKEGITFPLLSSSASI